MAEEADMRKSFVVALAVAAATLAGCTAGRKSSSGFHLPDGNVERGQAAFVELRCHSCHEVEGLDLPAPVADPPVAVVLGGVVAAARTDGELTAAVIDPSHRIAPQYPAKDVTAGTRSRMGDLGESMTVRQLVDLVAFLQSRYEVRQPEVIAGP
jgi:L-cysteine S-thiosulfotransferase